jgi:hypothetical protein
MPAPQYTRSWAGSEANGGIRPRFYFEAVQDQLATAREGRPIFRQEERVELFMAGNPQTVPVMRVTDEERRRWPEAYAAFKKGEETALEGTPLEEWPRLNRAQVRELKGIEVYTVEDVATLSDLALQPIMGGMGLRNMARAFLDDAVRMAVLDEKSQENDILKSQIAALENQVKELGEITRRMHGELMGMKNAPNPLAAVIPGLSDPMQIAAMQQPGAAMREAPQSSLAQFAEVQARRRGRPAKNPGPGIEEEDLAHQARQGMD